METGKKPGDYVFARPVYRVDRNKPALAEVETTLNAVTVEQLGLEQVQAEEKLRVLGVIPNFYVAYDHNAVPLTAKLRYRLAFKTGTDVVRSLEQPCLRESIGLRTHPQLSPGCARLRSTIRSRLCNRVPSAS